MVHISTNLIYALQVKSSGRYLDGRVAQKTDPLMSEAGNGPEAYGSFLWWKFESIGDGYCALKCVCSGAYLDGRDTKHDDVLLKYTSSPSSYSMCKWKFSDNGNGYVSIKCQSSYYLDGRAGNKDNVLVTNSSPSGNDCLTWKLVPLKFNIEALIQDFEFPEDIETTFVNNKSLQYDEKTTVHCDTPGLETGSEFKDTVSNTYTFTFNESIGIGMSIKIHCGIPLIGASVTVDANGAFDASQSISKTSTQEIDEWVKFKPEEVGDYECGMKVWESKDNNFGFIAKIIWNGINNNSENNGKSLTGNDILCILDYYGNECINDIVVNDTSVEASIDGILTGGWYVEKEVWSKELNSSTCSIRSKL